MSYRNKTYVCLDYDEDKNYYNMMLAWVENDKIDFDFYNAHDLNNLLGTSSEETIKAKLKERMLNSKNFIVLIGEKTKTKYQFVRWEMEKALELGLPIIAVNLNKKRNRDDDRVPPIIREELVVHIGFYRDMIKYALDNWPAEYSKLKGQGITGPRVYNTSVYEGLGIK